MNIFVLNDICYMYLFLCLLSTIEAVKDKVLRFSTSTTCMMGK